MWNNCSTARFDGTKHAESCWQHRIAASRFSIFGCPLCPKKDCVFPFYGRFLVIWCGRKHQISPWTGMTFITLLPVSSWSIHDADGNRVMHTRNDATTTNGSFCFQARKRRQSGRSSIIIKVWGSPLSLLKYAPPHNFFSVPNVVGSCLTWSKMIRMDTTNTQLNIL